MYFILLITITHYHTIKCGNRNEYCTSCIIGKCIFWKVVFDMGGGAFDHPSHIYKFGGWLVINVCKKSYVVILYYIVYSKVLIKIGVREDGYRSNKHVAVPFKKIVHDATT